MTTLTENLDLPGGVDPYAVRYKLFVVGENGTPLGSAYGPGSTIIKALTGTPDADGVITIPNVVPTEDIVPSGSRYAIIFLGSFQPHERRYLNVPDSVSPRTILSCLSDAPAALLPPAVEQALKEIEIGANSAEGIINVDNLTWVMTHNRGYTDAGDLNPNLWYFADQTGLEMEPVSIDYVNPDVAIATWLDPVRGTWRLN